MKINHPEDATPILLEELMDLIPRHLTRQEDLNAWEEKNILLARAWAYKQKDIISISFVQELHRRMFSLTWKWAGKFRTTEKNLGVSWHLISTEVKKLCEDVKFQLEHATFTKDEIAVRFHHKLVWIHPFSNGNGRHARLMADLLITSLGRPRFNWGMQQDLHQLIWVRKHYIEALQSADRGDYSRLLTFARF